MPETEPMTGLEIARAVKRIESGISAIADKLDTKIDKVDQRFKDAEQDAAIKEVEHKIDKIIWSIAGLAFTSIGGLFLALANRGLIS